MGEVLDGNYWCHMCSQIVNPVMEVEIKCPFCESGFVEEMGSSRREDQHQHQYQHQHQQLQDPDLGSDRALSLWAPILLGMMGRDSRRHRRLRRETDESEEDDEEEGNRTEQRGEGMDFDRLQRGDLESILWRRRRSSAAILHLLRGLRAGILSEQENDSERERENQHREHVILINPFNQAIILQGSSSSLDMNQLGSGSLGDYLIGPGLDALLQHLAENDPNRYGTPPAKKDAVEAMPTVTIGENLQCSVCLDDFEIGSEAKEMPCKHKFHSGCIMPWLKLHSSCPVCRFQMPSDEASAGAVSFADNNNRSGESSGDVERGAGNDNGDGGEEGNGNGRRNWLPIPWPFHGLFSQNGGTSSSSSSSAFGSSTHHADEN